MTEWHSVLYWIEDVRFSTAGAVTEHMESLLTKYESVEYSIEKALSMCFKPMKTAVYK